MSTPYTIQFDDGRKWIIHDRVVHGADAEVATWVQEKVGGGMVESLFVALGIIRNNMRPDEVTEDNLASSLIGGAIFFDHHHTGGRSDITVTVANDDLSAAHPDVIRRILRFPFRQLGVRRISAEIVSDNERSIRNAEAIGFKIEGIKEGAAGDGALDIVMLGLRPENCPIWQRERGED